MVKVRCNVESVFRLDVFCFWVLGCFLVEYFLFFLVGFLFDRLIEIFCVLFVLLLLFFFEQTTCMKSPGQNAAVTCWTVG